MIEPPATRSPARPSRSVDYHGNFQRLFARLSLIGTPLAIVASVALGLL